jgi:hypothetical protein
MRTTLMNEGADLLPGQDLPHLEDVGASMRQVVAAHFLKGCKHIIEIGGHVRPIIDYLTHSPKSVTSIGLLGERLFSLVDNAKIVVLEYSPALERATSQVPEIIGRKALKIRTTLDLRLNDPEIVDTPCAERRLVVLGPAENSKSA